MANLKSKIGYIVPAICGAVLPFVSQITMSGASVSLESSELTAMGTALTDGGSSLLNVGIQLLPYLAAFTIIMMVFGLVKNLGNLKARWGSRKSRRRR